MKYILLTLILLQGILMGAVLKDININDTKIPVIFEKNNKLPIFNIQLIFKNSGYINDKKQPGITKFIAQVLNEGTKKDGSVNFARKLENKAISLSINTGVETFVIEISCLKEEIDNALKYLCELLKDPNLTKETFRKIQLLTISKLQQKENDFDWVASNGLKQILFKNSALEYPSSGTLNSIKTLTLHDIKKRLKSLFNINNLIIATGGDIKFKTLKTKLEPILKNLTKHPVKTFKSIVPLDNMQEKIIYKDTKQAYIYFGSPFYLKTNDKENYKAKVASFILGSSGFGSRLMEEIRVKNGLAYSAYGYIINKKSYSSFQGYLQTKLENQQKAQQLVKKVISEFVANGVTQKELDAAKKFLNGSEPLRTETFSQRLNRAFSLYYKNLPFDYPQQELQKIDNLTLDELNKFIKKHTEITKLSFSIVLQKTSKKELD